MTPIRLFATAVLLGSAGIASADIPPGPPPRPHPTEVPRHTPPRTRPATCGTGVGLALFGIAAVWGLIRAGSRLTFPGRSRKMVGDPSVRGAKS
jgi:hypothetical protein